MLDRVAKVKKEVEVEIDKVQEWKDSIFWWKRVGDYSQDELYIIIYELIKYDYEKALEGLHNYDYLKIPFIPR